MASLSLILLLATALYPRYTLSSVQSIDKTNPCVQNPCTNGGVCVVNGTSFFCQCPQGFHGQRCEFLPGQCSTNPCHRGVCQLDSSGSPRCFCVPGFAGKLCDINEDECASSPCRNGGLCVDQINGYRCSCKQGSYGLHCELMEKQIQKCVKGCDAGLCWRNKSRVISVEWGYSDSICNTKHSCFGGPNNSLSITPDDEFIDVQIRPQQLQLGDSLNFTLDENMAPYVAGLRPCLGDMHVFFSCNETNGTFVVPHRAKTVLVGQEFLREGIWHFIDNVDATFRCEFGLRLNVSVKVNKCHQPGSVVQCSNHGQCTTNFSISSYHCKCCGGFRGEFCEKANHCFSKPCKNEATCKNTDDGGQESYMCTCVLGYEGRHCSKVIDMCASKPCHRDAACTPLVNNFACACPKGYTGKICDAELNSCSSNPCENNSTCVNRLDSFKCLCAAGFTGSHCEVNINECSSSPCQHGICIDQVNSYKCYCKPGFGGVNCGLNLNECLSNPCKNGGFCVDEENSYRCDCGHGFRGRHCDVDIELCKEPGWCVHRVSCKDNGNNIDCTCKPGFTGANCAVDIHECASNPCLNGGTCRDEVNDFQCLCKPEFSGKTCEIGGNPGSEQPRLSVPVSSSQTLQLRLLTEDCHLLKDSVLAKDILRNITTQVAKACDCDFSSQHVIAQSMVIQCMDSISAKCTLQILPVHGHSVKQLTCALWHHIKQHKNVIELGHNTFIVKMLNTLSSQCKHKGRRLSTAEKAIEPSTNLSVMVGSICAVIGLVFAAIVVCCKCRQSQPHSFKRHKSRVEDDVISDLSGDLLAAVAPTPKSMYRTSGGYHNMAFGGRFDPENPIKSRKV